ncbi:MULTISPECIES: DUF2069 domain-containing protein [unclassified Methylophilus]|jgi:uncharacterized membrane protein|uniref:DUF2069 domain-containing protein n=1 Tax=unclassified Methylophilus TaxID=2630143 RepID=UPI0023B29FE2|nr:DUF2069 domain-containing protein [Methylophilus sp. YYY-1]MDF0378400.1 DUF2069 domain-containing protein [Methylophilus sp. YYY-1]BEV07799.1 DUF2069 domain-containing protein [Methylophilus sp. DW102]
MIARWLMVSRWVASVSLIALIVLCLGWEILWAPLRAGGSLLFLKVLPLLGPLFGILRGKRYTYQWSGMLILFYFTEGVVRTWSETGLSQWLALAEVIFSALFFASVVTYAKFSGSRYQAA